MGPSGFSKGAFWQPSPFFAPTVKQTCSVPFRQRFPLERAVSSLPHLWGIEPTFAGVSPAQGQISYVLLSSAPRSCTSRLAWLSRTLIAVLSGGINQNFGFAHYFSRERSSRLFRYPCICFRILSNTKIFAVRAFIPHELRSHDHPRLYDIRSRLSQAVIRSQPSSLRPEGTAQNTTEIGNDSSVDSATCICLTSTSDAPPIPATAQKRDLRKSSPARFRNPQRAFPVTLSSLTYRRKSI